MRGVVWLGVAVAALLIAVAAVIGWPTQPERIAGKPEAAPPVAPPPTAAVKPADPNRVGPNPDGSNPAAAAAAPPSFDIVTVDRQGQAVIAGRAMPGDQVRVLDGDKPLGEATADARGEWVVVPAAPVAPGTRQLGLEASGKDGGAVRRSPDTVALSVGPPGDGKQAQSPMAVLLPGDPVAAPRVLQRPDAPAAKPALSLETAQYDAQDKLILSGQADPGARLNVYAGDRLLGTATADAAGKWALVSSYRQPAGGVELRLDQLAADGSVARRVAAPFNLPPGVALTGGDTYVVQRGNSLWLIARRIYGQGVRYTAIYLANQDQIRDPHRIYPGQQFKLPKS